MSVKIISLGRFTSETMDLKDGDVVSVSNGELKLIAAEIVKTFSCSCTLVNGLEFYYCKEAFSIDASMRDALFDFRRNPSDENEDLLSETIKKFKAHIENNKIFTS